MEEGDVRVRMCEAITRKGTGCRNRAKPGSKDSAPGLDGAYIVQWKHDTEGFFIFCQAVSGRNGKPWLPPEIKGMIYRYVVGPTCNHFDRCATLIGMLCCECSRGSWACGLCRASMRRCQRLG